MSDTIQLKFNKVSKIYPENIIALEDVDFGINKGEFVFVVGPSGAGKSTLLRLLIKQENPTSGSIVFEDLEVPQIPEKMLPNFRQKLGIVFQDLKLIDSKTVEENIAFALEITDKPDNEILETTKYLMNIVRVDNRAKLFPHELSGGERQKVAIARALATDPKLFIADEPTGNLDPENTVEIINILKTINSLRKTVMVITHDDYMVDAVQTRVIRMSGGKIQSDSHGGYFTNILSKEDILKNLVQVDINQIQENKEEKAEAKEVIAEYKKRKIDKELKSLIDDKDIRNILKQNGVYNIEILLDKTEEELEKMFKDANQLEYIYNKLSTYVPKENEQISK